jgi:hypothetical protein
MPARFGRDDRSSPAVAGQSSCSSWRSRRRKREVRRESCCATRATYSTFASSVYRPNNVVAQPQGVTELVSEKLSSPAADDWILSTVAVRPGRTNGHALPVRSDPIKNVVAGNPDVLVCHGNAPLKPEIDLHRLAHNVVYLRIDLY